MENLRPFIEQVHDKIVLLKSSSSTMSSKNIAASIGTAVSLVVLYSLYSKIFESPRKLRHIPHINYFKYIIRSLQKKPFGEIEKELVLPLLHPAKGEMYLKPDRLGWTVFVANPEAAKTIFLKTDIFPKADMSSVKAMYFLAFTGLNNILFANKDEWKKHRKLANPSFHRQMPLKLFAELTHKVFSVIDQQKGQPVDVVNMMERFTLDAIGLAGFGVDFKAILEGDNEWVNTYDAIKKGMAEPLYFLFPILESRLLWLNPARQKQREALTKFNYMMNNVIETKRRSLKFQQQTNNVEDAEKDLLRLMMESELSGEGILTNDELREDLSVFFAAGHDTTANGLSFAIHALARDPKLQRKARDEAIAVLGDTPEDVFPTPEQIKEFKYINQVIKETLRLNGPVTAGVVRRASKDTELAGNFIPKDTLVNVSIYNTHHNPYVWKDPERFNPDRFAPGGEAEQKAGGGMAWIPFSNGQRMCIGMNFSLNEQRIMLPSLLRKYEWYLPEDSIHKDKVITGTVGIMTAKDLNVIFKRRY